MQEFQPTPEQREDVDILVGGGMGEEDISRAIGIARETLRKHFADELANGRSRKRAAAIKALFQNVKTGNVAAVDRYLKLSDPIPTPAATTAEKNVGKKAAAIEAAQSAAEGTPWGQLVN